MGRREKHRVFKPRRRAFFGRPKALLSPQTWAIGFAGIAFGAAVTAHWPTVPQGTAPRPAAALAAPAAARVEIADPTPAVAVPVTFAAAEAAPEDERQTAEPPPETARIADTPPLLAGAVARVVDGDTFYLDGVETRMRLWGVDAPEKDEVGAMEATEALANLVAGRTLACEEMDRDRYGRIVARCALDDGRDIARVLIDIGAATEMLRYSGGYYGG